MAWTLPGDHLLGCSINQVLALRRDCPCCNCDCQSQIQHHQNCCKELEGSPPFLTTPCVFLSAPPLRTLVDEAPLVLKPCAIVLPPVRREERAVFAETSKYLQSSGKLTALLHAHRTTCADMYKDIQSPSCSEINALKSADSLLACSDLIEALRFTRLAQALWPATSLGSGTLARLTMYLQANCRTLELDPMPLFLRTNVASLPWDNTLHSRSGSASGAVSHQQLCIP